VVHTLQQLDVDREVEGNLALFLLGLKLSGFVLGCRDSLRKKFLVLCVLANVREDLVRFFDFAKTESR
jgi:hypothetical protein